MTSMHVLGIHRDPWHDTGAAIISEHGKDREIFMVSEERLDRIKDSRSFPEKSIAACLASAGLTSIDDVDLVVLDYIERPDWRRDEHLRPAQQDTILDRVDPSKIRVINHHLSHAYVAFHSSPFEDAAVLIVDGRGSEKETQTLFRADRNGIKLLARTKQIGIGLLYAAVTQAIRFGLLQEGKTMGLAPYGDPAAASIFQFDGSFDGITTDYSNFCVDGSYDIKADYPPLDTFELKAKAALEVQEECERAMLHLARYAREQTGLDNLCLSGGVALNSVANYRILKSGLFRDVFINPAASDTGIPLGCALYGYEQLGGRLRAEISPYLGPRYSPDEIEQAIRAFPQLEVVRSGARERAGQMLADNKIVARFEGRSEIGPRALGHRSILMSPLRAENKDVLNSRVKFREAFRPFAPAVLEERASEYFAIDRECPYMLLIPDVLPHMRSVIPAVTHVDGTARLQTVTRSRNGAFYDIVEEFGRATGVPVLLNTSFNVAGEPIVETPIDAIKCFLGTDIDALYMEDLLLLKGPSR